MVNQPRKRKIMEPNKVPDLAEDSFGQRVAQKVSRVAETAGQKVDEAVGYMEKTKSQVTQSFEKVKAKGFHGLKQKTLDYIRDQPLTALALAAGAGILFAWAMNKGKSTSKDRTIG
jgi:ElaB/YqjD/DUF883 family membrane-anchored ribosome-binding protein